MTEEKALHLEKLHKTLDLIHKGMDLIHETQGDLEELEKRVQEEINLFCSQEGAEKWK